MVAEVVVMSVWDCLDNNKLLQGDCLEVLKTLPDKSVDMCVTSPPYYGLRDYGTGEWVGGVVLDPFFGSGTTGIVANRLNRSYIGVELNEEYVDIAKKRNSDKQLTLAGII